MDYLTAHFRKRHSWNFTKHKDRTHELRWCRRTLRQLDRRRLALEV